MKKIIIPLSLLILLLGGCIGDDIIFDTVPENLRILNPLDTLAVGDTYAFTLLFTNNVGLEEQRTATWLSSDPNVLSVDNTGQITGVSKGQAMVTATVELADQSLLSVSHQVIVDQETVIIPDTGTSRKGVIKSTSNYVLKGSFEVSKEGSDLIIEIGDDYEATTSLPGLYIYLSNNPGSKDGALEIGAVKVFQGAHQYVIGGDISLKQYNYLLYYCKPFNIKVGEGPIGE